MKPLVRGKTVFLREITVDDAAFVHKLRTDPEKGRYLSETTGGVKQQEAYIASCLKQENDFYFIICDWEKRALGTVRIYDIRQDSFCWGSWILSNERPKWAALESALLIYDFAFFSLHYRQSHFDVRKENERVVNFHKRLGARIVRTDDKNIYFNYSREEYLAEREKYTRYLP